MRAPHLDHLSLHPAADAHLGTEDYLVGILTEDLISHDDKVDGMVEFLSMTFADEPAMSPDLAAQIVSDAMTKYSDLVAVATASCEAQPHAADNDGDSASGSGSGSDSGSELDDGDDHHHNQDLSSPTSGSAAGGKRLMTKDELKRRRAILQQYGYEGSESDADIALSDPVKAAAMAGQLQLPKKKSKRANIGYDVLIAMPNDNKQKQQSAEQAKRAAMKAQHDAKVARDKAALAKQKAAQAAKEAGKKTVKQEKRRM
ncbi:hypothetical protein BCR44DRAFT_1515001 [Catenaria anguillulae PL171]|uniref:Uncharacterized protein n=1 Tax=Catenaria anguillulae PL171 TaxID=765915 RepID=A0A1Y2HEM7_9FUNG|nr:hypothetical protein BCR44DRAFT_1515001 [Catenaria anguillulae PL171]